MKNKSARVKDTNWEEWYLGEELEWFNLILVTPSIFSNLHPLLLLLNLDSTSSQ